MKHTFIFSITDASGYSSLKEALSGIGTNLFIGGKMVQGYLQITITRYPGCDLSDTELGIIIGNHINRRDIIS